MRSFPDDLFQLRQRLLAGARLLPTWSMLAATCQGMVTMTELVTHDERPKPSEHGPVLVSGNRLATHFGVSRQHVERLTAEGVIERRSDGLFDQDASRLRYNHLRAEHKRSPRTEADAAHAKAKTELLQIRIMERQRKLVRREDVNELIDAMCGTVLMHLSGRRRVAAATWWSGAT
jgi:hypothetical protein